MRECALRIVASNIVLSSKGESVSFREKRESLGFSNVMTMSQSKESYSQTTSDIYMKSDSYFGLLDFGNEDLYKEAASKFKEIEKGTNVVKNKDTDDEMSAIDKIRLNLLLIIYNMISKLSGEGITDRQRSIMSELSNMANGLNGYIGSMSYSLVSYEKSATQFSGCGRAITEDGRVIDFGISFGMSREFIYTERVDVNALASALLDPLVINVDSNITSISDQSFYFDLDCDGENENINMLSKGSGFLAMDKNGDGIINDGSELFGAKSGDGFAELSEYDEDGNGWIDENDENTWRKLKVWIKDDKGTDKLLTLGEAGVGAIYLGNVTTNIEEKNDTGNVNGVIRKSGLYLKENGTTGTIQHVDLAIH